MVRIALMLLAMAIVAPALADPVAVAGQDGVQVLLTNEKCTLAAVSNLPMRATWTDSGKAIEGCYTVQGGLVVTFWSDATVVVIPATMFKRAVGA